MSHFNKDYLRDVFYKMYFYIPDVSENKPSYKSEFVKFWKRYGITVDSAQIKYSDSYQAKFDDKFFDSANNVDVNISFYNDNTNLDIGEAELKQSFNDTIREIYRTNPSLPHDVNEYWKKHAKELLFIITIRNDIKNLAIKSEVQKSLSEFNDNALRFINELIQNADDCEYKDDFNRLTMLFDQTEREIVISYPEEGFTYDDIISLSSINETNKMTDFDKATTTIGEKGRGFKSIFVYFKEVEIESGGYHFKYNIDEANMFQPIYLGKSQKENGTNLILRLKDEIILTSEGNHRRIISSGMNELVEDVKDFYGAKDPVKLYRNNSIFFTRNFTELVMIFSKNGTSDIIRITNTHKINDVDSKQKLWWNSTDDNDLHYCIGSMAYHYGTQIANEDVNYKRISALPLVYKLNLVGMVKYLNYNQDIISSRYGSVREDQIPIIKRSMPIIIYGIKDIETTDNFDDISVSSFTGHMYTYLPTSLNISLPFIFQMPFDLEDNRSCPKSKNEWNHFLLDKVWNPYNSIIKDWYEYIAAHKLVDSIYNYIPTMKNSIGDDYRKLAFYLDDKYTFDPQGGRKYAAFARDQIATFNSDNAESAKTLFETISIFANKDCEDLVCIDKLRILDRTLALFDDENENIYWTHFKARNPILYRFVFDSESDISNQVIAFQKYIRHDNIVLQWKGVMENSRIRNSIACRMQECGKSHNFELMNRFTKRFLSENIWLSAFKLGKITELSEDNIKIIRQLGVGLLFFMLPFIDGSSKWVKYDSPEKSSANLWLTTESEIVSHKIQKDDNGKKSMIRVCVLNSGTDAYKKTIINQLIGQSIDTYDDLLSHIENWSDKRVSNEDKLQICEAYYLRYRSDDEAGINIHISNLFNRVQDINSSDVVICPVTEDENEQNKVEWERMRFFSWHGSGKKSEFKLNLKYLSEPIAEIINYTSDNTVTCYDKHISFLEAVTGRHLTDDEKNVGLESFKKTYRNCIINPEYFNYLPNRNFLKFAASGYLLLKSEEYLIEACDSDTHLTTEFIQNVRDKYKKIQSNRYETGNLGRNIGTIKAIQAYQIYSLIDNNNYREVIGKEGDVCNELLQNINDFITPGSNVAIEITSEEDGVNWMTLVYEEKSHIEVVKGSEVEKHGFLPSDILALISIGNSTKDKDGEKYTGNKGIGFKNVYKVFDQVFIDSNGFRFLLDDSYSVDAEVLFEELNNNKVGNIYSDKNCKVEAILKELEIDKDFIDEKGFRRRFPIIQVSPHEISKDIYFINSGLISQNKNISDSLTAFRFRFRSDEMADYIQKQLRGSYLVWLFSKNKDMYEAFKQVDITANDYNMLPLFLHNLRKINLFENGDEKEFITYPICDNEMSIDNGWAQSQFFYSNRGTMTGLNLLGTKSDRYERKKNTESDGVFSHVEVRFIKNPVLVTQNNEKVTVKDGRLYIALPTEMNTGGAVHINIPALEAKSNRRDIFSLSFDVTKEGEWNQSIIKKALGVGGVFEELFNSFTEKYCDIVANYAFLYVPISLFSRLSADFPQFNSCFEELKYIPCRTRMGLKMRCLREILDNPNVFVLDTYMRAWFELMDSEYEIFYRLSDSDIEFFELTDENDWGLMDELEKRPRLSPALKTYSSREFFEYISQYWKHYYSQLDSEYQKTCDKKFNNRIKLITAKTGIENHYSKWQTWKKIYKENMAGKRKESYIGNMIKAICFDCIDFSSAFYFTAHDINLILNLILENEKLEIPSKVVKHYKEYLTQRGYRDFMPYYGLLMTEINDTEVVTGNSTAVQIKVEYSLAISRNGHREVLVPIRVKPEDILSCAYNSFGVNSLEDLRSIIPVLLMNNTFLEANEQEYFLELPKKLFKENSLELRTGEEYDPLMDSWVEKGYVVSRANIAEADNIYTLDILDSEFYDLLPTFSDSRLFLKLLDKNKMYDQDIVNNVLQFWKAREQADSGQNRADYFELYIDALTIFISANSNITISEPELMYEIEFLKSKKIISTCNKLSTYKTGGYRNEHVFKILLEDQYETNPTMYWNEIEMSLTATQRRAVASLYYGEEMISDEDVNKGIELFLNHLYMCSENVSLYSHYPSSQYLRVFVNDEPSFVLFKDYTDSIILLLREVFGFSLGSKLYKPFVNLYEYNALLPLGSQEEYSLVRENVFNILDSQTDDKTIHNMKMQLMALQFQLPDNRLICGYGMNCPFIKSNDVIEQSSLQTFECSLFGFHIAITLYGSREAKEVLLKYAAKTVVKVCKKKMKKKKGLRLEEFEVCNGKYSFDNRELVLRGADIEKERLLVINILDYLIKELDDINNNLVFEIEMISDKGAKKKEVFKLNLTHCHRAIMVYELTKAKEGFVL